MNLLIDNVMKDVMAIYSCDDETTKNYDKDYELKDGSKVINSIQIVYKRTWEGMAIFCGVDMRGKAEIRLFYRNEPLENLITTLIEAPVNSGMAGSFPIVSEISFGIHPKIKPIAHMWIFGAKDEGSELKELPAELIKHVASFLY